MGRKSKKSTRKRCKRQNGGSITLQPANFTADPTLFSNSFSQVKNSGCSGTTSNILAANGIYSQAGGGVCQAQEPLVTNITGVKSSYSAIQPCPTFSQQRSLYIGGRRRTKRRKLRGKKSRRGGKRRRSRGSRRRRRQRGGNQPFSNIAYTPGYSTGGQLSSYLSALANPVPYTAYNNCN